MANATVALALEYILERQAGQVKCTGYTCAKTITSSLGYKVEEKDLSQARVK